MSNAWNHLIIEVERTSDNKLHYKTITLNGNKLKATLKLVNQAGGTASAQLVVVGKRETNIPIDLVRQEGDFLTLVCSPYHMSWEGRFRKDAKELPVCWLVSSGIAVLR